MRHLRFHSLDELLIFLLACERREGLGRSGKRSLYEFVHIQENAYAIAFQDRDWPEPRQCHGGELGDGEPSGHRVHINDLLQHILLLSVPVGSPGSASSLVLAVFGPELKPEEAERRLYAAWRDVLRLNGAISRFFFKAGDNAEQWVHAVEIEQVDPAFDFDAFHRRHSGVRAFDPAWDDARCFLYVERGYRYPKAREFFYLFDETRDFGGSKLILCTAEPLDAPPQHASRKEAAGWSRPVWHQVGTMTVRHVDDIYAIDTALRPKVIPYKEDAPASAPLKLALAIGDSARAVGSLSELERCISLHERELEQLLAKRERALQAVRGEFLPVYLWRQGQANGETRLPAGLEEFLKRPLGELARYTYARVRVTGGWQHFLVGQAHVPAGAARAVPCDHVYLCETRWADWGLPLYIRADCSLNLHINESELAHKVWALLEAQGISSEAQIILVEPRPAPDGHPLEGMAGLQFSLLEAPTPASSSLQLTNELTQGPETVARLAGESAGAAVRLHSLEAPPELQELDQTLRARVGELLADTERRWEELRQRLLRTALERRIADLALDATEAAYGTAAATWVEFVNLVFELDQTLADLKLAALQNWTAAEEERRHRLRQIEHGQSDVKAEIARTLADYEDKLPVFHRENSEIEQALAEVKKRHAEVSAQHHALQKRRESLDAEHRKLTEAATKLHRDLVDARQSLARLEAMRDALADQTAQLGRVKAEAGTLQSLVHAAEQDCAKAAQASTQELDALERRAQQALGFVHLHRKKAELPPQRLAPPRWWQFRRWFDSRRR